MSVRRGPHKGKSEPMSSPSRRSGFRLPWSGQDRPAEKTDGSAAAGTDTADAAAAEQETASETPAAAKAPTTSDATDATAAGEPEATEPETAEQPETSAESETAEAAPTDIAGPADTAAPTDAAPKETEPEPPRDLLRELVTAMRRVADDAREVDLRDLRPRVDERLARFRTEAAERAAELRQQADADVTDIGEWARTEAERIKAESEARVGARRKELEEQLATAERQVSDGTEEVRRRVAEYERSLDAFFTQLGDITDPAAFAAAAKEMPRPPEIEEVAGADTADTAGSGASAAMSDTETSGAAPPDGDSHGTSGSTVVVKGLSSFGSITAFKQSLESVEGVSEVTLSLGPTGEFVYRAVHSEGFDLQGAIAAMERGAAAVERQADGTLQVTVGRGR